MDFTIASTIEILGRTPTLIREYFRELSDAWIQNDYGENTWSAHQVLGHLIWGERTDWIPRVRHILEHGDSLPFVPFDRDGHEELCKSSTTQELVDVFQRERLDNLQVLQDLELTESDLEKRGLHPALGAVTIRELLSTWTVHDLNHIAQISKAMAYQYRDLVGPWEAYLSILAPPNPR